MISALLQVQKWRFLGKNRLNLASSVIDSFFSCHKLRVKSVFWQNLFYTSTFVNFRHKFNLSRPNCDGKREIRSSQKTPPPYQSLHRYEVDTPITCNYSSVMDVRVAYHTQWRRHGCPFHRSKVCVAVAINREWSAISAVLPKKQ